MEARANKVRRRSIRKARKQTRDRIRRNVRRKVAEMAFGRTHFGAAVLGDKRRTFRRMRSLVCLRALRIERLRTLFALASMPILLCINRTILPPICYTRWRTQKNVTKDEA